MIGAAVCFDWEAALICVGWPDDAMPARLMRLPENKDDAPVARPEPAGPGVAPGMPGTTSGSGFLWRRATQQGR